MFATSGRARLAFDSTGAEGGAGVLLIHAGVNDRRSWAHVVDRVKDMYISGGENVYPAEVEAVAVRLDGVANCAVVGVADRRWGEVGAAYVQVRDGASLAEADLRSD
jgi:acyl-CoA synthetase (AMP-forming)/AMP-acid ligase II